MTDIGNAPTWAVVGPPPIAPKYGLLPAADVPGSGVRIVPDTDAAGEERWGNGIEMWPYPTGLALVRNEYAAGSNIVNKGFGDEQPANPAWWPITASFTEQCTAAAVFNDEQEYRARAFAVFGAVETASVERELLTGGAQPANPHLADGVGDFPNGNNVTSVLNGLALLEGQIARSGRMGLIHVSPMTIEFLHRNGVVYDVNGVLKTGLGITVIPGFGYVDGDSPEGHPASVGWEEWIYATGPIDLRRTAQPVLLQETLKEALDRGLGATNGRPNNLVYTVERYYVVAYDTAMKAAVLVDRCQETCGTAPS